MARYNKHREVRRQQAQRIEDEIKAAESEHGSFTRARWAMIDKERSGTRGNAPKKPIR